MILSLLQLDLFRPKPLPVNSKDLKEFKPIYSPKIIYPNQSRPSATNEQTSGVISLSMTAVIAACVSRGKGFGYKTKTLLCITELIIVSPHDCIRVSIKIILCHYFKCLLQNSKGRLFFILSKWLISKKTPSFVKIIGCLSQIYQYLIAI